MAKAVPQWPRERLIAGNVRVIAPSGKTTWKIKADKNFDWRMNAKIQKD